MIKMKKNGMKVRMRMNASGKFNHKLKEPHQTINSDTGK
jgi:hypothetical protein